MDEHLLPLPEPAGGWRVIDPGRTTHAALGATLEAAARLPGYGGCWIDGRLVGTREQTPDRVIAAVAVTHDADAAYRTLRAIWGGMLAVVTVKRTWEQLCAMRDEVIATAPPGWLHYAGPDPLRNGVSIGVDVDVPSEELDGLRADFERRYGPDSVGIELSHGRPQPG